MMSVPGKWPVYENDPSALSVSVPREVATGWPTLVCSVPPSPYETIRPACGVSFARTPEAALRTSVTALHTL